VLSIGLMKACCKLFGDVKVMTLFNCRKSVEGSVQLEGMAASGLLGAGKVPTTVHPGKGDLGVEGPGAEMG
jgi:hypothetical protein